MEFGLLRNIDHDEWKKHTEVGAIVTLINDSATLKEVIGYIAHKMLVKPSLQEDWPVRQALAYCRNTPEDVLRDFFARHDWYLWLGLANNSSCPRDILEHFADLPVEVCGVHKGYGGYDQNKEIREIARKRLGIAGFAYPDEYKQLYKDLNEYVNV